MASRFSDYSVLERFAQDPWRKGWLIRVKPGSKRLDHLLDAEAYEALIAKAH